ncbi:NAD(P)-dependent oxidoreductase [Clostridium chrysemydis]|uniref:NAD(P)-dependent oxidoreductase n=1 Tax=Clostridium chrysemydis TaxID=2665504 RepID=UPI0018844D8B|nr:NAD(P)-dependent oxidoreductase [Clostridium chrysemydis]
MFKDNREDISRKELNRMNLSVLSSKINTCIIGGGKGALIKLKGLLNRGCKVTLVSKEIINEIYEIRNPSLKIIKDEYKKEYIYDKHLILIAIDNDLDRDLIKKDLEENFKLYIDCSNFKEGNTVIPMQGSENGINLSISTLDGNPKGARFLYSKITETILKYGDFIEFSSKIRNSIKNREEKNEVLNFILNDDFKFYFDKKKENIVLKMFYKNLFR